MTATTPQRHLKCATAETDDVTDEVMPNRVARGLLVTEQDEELLERVRTLRDLLNSGATVVLTHERDPDRFAQEMGDLGWVLADAGADLQARAGELRQAGS
ncbi:MAG: hypothetical protein GEU83_17425 [Pseudonocardiaceae bacterium]|nr:hypothetical protein [Pseudonocardiaceae bacterium]